MTQNGYYKQPTYTGEHLGATYMKMVSNKIMIGGDVFYRTRFENNNSQRYFSQSFNISPTIRYYFSTNRLATFVYFKQNFSSYNEIRDERFSFHNRTFLGLGANYFLDQNIAFEGLLTSDLKSSGSIINRVKNISFSTRIKYFFNTSPKSKVRSLPEKVFRKGNVQTSSKLLGSGYNILSSGGSFSFSPNIRYFITDRFNIYGRSSYYNSMNHSHSLSFDLGSEYFFKLGEVLYLNLGFIGKTSYMSNRLSENDKRSSYTIYGTASSALHYFHKRKRIYLGIRYNNWEKRSNKKVVDRGDRFRVFTGLDFFVQENIYVKGEFNFDTGIYSSSKKSEILSLGIGFILDSNKIQLKSKKNSSR